MKTDRFTKTILVIIAALLFLNLVSNLLPLQQAIAQQEGGGQVNRYQISAWSSFTGAYGHHSGYYVLDTMTGKVIDKHEEAHESGK